MLVVASYGRAISLVSARPPWRATKTQCVLSATRTPLHKLLPFSDLLTSQEHGVLALQNSYWDYRFEGRELYTNHRAKAIGKGLDR